VYLAGPHVESDARERLHAPEPLLEASERQRGRPPGRPRLSGRRRY
jgi:hypothetical protein